MYRVIIGFIMIVLLGKNAFGHDSNCGCKDTLAPPPHYNALYTNKPVIIDGLSDDSSWSKVKWTRWFGDIVSGKTADTLHKTRCKMLWDMHYLYLYVQLIDPDVWATIKQHDHPVMFDNAFEMFIDPDGDTHNYFEFQMNAFGTTCDLFLPKPYHEGGHAVRSWTMNGLKKAVRIEGTINNPNDTDSGWSIELAIPFSALSNGMLHVPGEGTVWRMNFSRVIWPVQVENGEYMRKKKRFRNPTSAHYSVWSPQGQVNLHYPERWGYVTFK